MIFFFFSSRRRHTRSLRDWSSDVCSSDLLDPVQGAGKRVRDRRQVRWQVVWQRDQVLDGDRRDRGPLGVRAREGIVAVQQVVLAEILEPVAAVEALPAGED